MCSLPLLSSHECQRKQSLSNLQIIILCFAFLILAQVLFFLFQSTACSGKAEVRVQTSPISKPANIFGVSQQFVSISIFNCVVILCIYSIVFFTEKRYWIRILFTVGNVDRDIGRYSGRYSVDSRSILGRHSVDSRSTLGRYSVDTRSTLGRHSGR